MSELIFVKLLDKMIKYDYDTIGSLQDMIRILDKLSDEEKVKHCIIIDKIKNTIKGYGTVNYQKLTNKQSKNLISVLQQFEFSDKIVMPEKSPIDKLICNQTEWKTDADVKANIVKINPDDTIYSIILNLLTNLSYDTLSSQMNNVIVDYLDMVNDILIYEPKYINVTNEIEIMLKNNGWTSSGFYSEPNKNKLIEQLQPIINKYLF